MVKEIAQYQNCKSSIVGLSQNIHYFTIPKLCVYDYTLHRCIITWIRLISPSANVIHIHVVGPHQHNWHLSKGFYSQMMHQVEITKLPQQNWGSKWQKIYGGPIEYVWGKIFLIFPPCTETAFYSVGTDFYFPISSYQSVDNSGTCKMMYNKSAPAGSRIFFCFCL